MRGIFGWSLPPGCGTLPGEEPCPPCAMCGRDPEGDDGCICVECPECGEVGAPDCYKAHGMVETDEQRAGRAALEETYRQQAEADKSEAEWWAQQEKEGLSYYEAREMEGE